MASMFGNMLSYLGYSSDSNSNIAASPGNHQLNVDQDCPDWFVVQKVEEGSGKKDSSEAKILDRQDQALIKSFDYLDPDLRELPTNEDVFELLRVDIEKKPGRGFGISIISHRNGRGVAVSEVVKGGESDGKIRVDDEVVEANGTNFQTSDLPAAATILKDLPMGTVQLTLKRVRTPKKVHSHGRE